jgi:CBS domain-containing protein
MYPVADGDGKFAGVLPLEAIERAARDGATDRSVRESLEQPKLVAVASEPVIDVVRRMQMNGADRSPVVDESQRIVGFISPSDILRVRMRHVTPEEEAPFEIFQ